MNKMVSEHTKLNPLLGLHTRELSHSVPDKVLYENLSIQFRRGQFTAVLGPNGAGKSTFLRDLVGLTKPIKGSVCLGEESIHDIAAHKRAQYISYLPQSTPLYLDLTVEEIIALGRMPHQGRFSSLTDTDRGAMLAAIKEVDLSQSILSRSINSLSGGERQRVMLARMLATESLILVLDEPISGLDLGHAIRFLELCKRLCSNGHTVVMAIHDLEFAARYADQVLLLTGDRLGKYAIGSASDIICNNHIMTPFGVSVERMASVSEISLGKDRRQGLVFFGVSKRSDT